MRTPFSCDSDLGKGFGSRFEILPALDQSTRDQVFTIRHEVYCEDLGFEPLREDRHETDEYDRHSVHCLLRTADESHTLVGCTRLVLARPEDPAHPFPFESACRANLDQHTIDSRALPRHKIAEVSRLAVRQMYRRRRGEKHTEMMLRNRDFGSSASPRFPFIPVGLYLGTMALAEQCGIEKVFVITEPRLAAHLSRLGFSIVQVGPPIEHRGTRVPSMMDVEQSKEGLRSLIRPMWELIRGGVMAGYEGRRAAMVAT
ncbi:PEP-CTERM/exosortase system-associated acyltransferase [Aromatoleum anaerobium]|uniref:PEP-CTERM/exosortase system-associated acyltransferase n=1 Tax=Aromatoleum anaerobium TaxID=182180 RepID=A0ABX1PIT1_9RHOO|nr:PEP-CTERM/exosortase system-associated acyltransferase [Aromatoleum anaerobium]MCK0506371.1 PEP-CTERM/exosortase system-associated acyltransferase [Aromatoleum anaerobium]